MVQHLATKEDFDRTLQQAAAEGKTVVIDFTATWCGPCNMIAPAFEALATEFKHVVFVKVDVDNNQETAQAEGIRAMPTFKAYRDSKEVGMVRGANEQALRDLVTQHAGDKWSAAGEGQSLGASSTGDVAGMSDREKRLAALARRGL
mmetsp:Transcript_9873/g.29113  ORF Transcript_9873/g.29113 Transcript_9873/m.29113 type:complete len:147 (-) Transcript_9873:950-1390(-)